MLADTQILNLAKVSLETKDLLPEYTGIYYVVDEKNTVWYIGKARNIRKRWQGKAHHRIYQLQNQKQNYFNIYYEQVNSSQLDRREKQQIKKFTPHLNNSPVRHKKIRPTETLLRETIATLSDFAFILGVEPPRREIKDKIGREWLTQEKILDTTIISICLDMTAFNKQLNIDSVNEYESLRVQPFMTRKAYASKWQKLPFKDYPLMFRLSVNGYIVEASHLGFWTGNSNLEEVKQYNQTTLANESIRVLTPESLKIIKNYNLEQKQNNIRLQRLKPYTSDLIPLLFNELIDCQAGKQKLYQLSQDYKTGKRGLGSRSHKIKSKSINSDFTTIDDLLISRRIDLNKYNQSNVISMQRGEQDRIGLYIQCFNLDPQIPRSYGKNIDGSTSPTYNSVVGVLNNKKVTLASYKFDIVYLLTSVEKYAWLLIEDYLNDFATVNKRLTNQEGVIRKFYVSPRKFIVPAKVNIKLEKMKYSAWIPFGMNDQYPTFDAAKEEIKKRLTKANLPALKLSFKKENITK